MHFNAQEITFIYFMKCIINLLKHGGDHQYFLSLSILKYWQADIKYAFPIYYH